MSDDTRSFELELSSSQYLPNGGEPTCESARDADSVGRSSACGVERTARYLSAVVLLLLLAAVGGLCWQHRQSIASSAAEFKKHSTSGVDMVLWASGSKQSFNEALADRLRKPAIDTSEMKPAFKTEFSNVDLQNLSSAWNGKHK